MIKLIIARHGNTFNKGETPTRVGSRTDIPLVDSGKEQAKLIGEYLVKEGMVPDVIYSSPLKRTMETAEIALDSMGVTRTIYPLDIFTEIDYGPDENKTEEEVIARIGEEAILSWNKRGIVPEGWLVNPEEIQNNWKGFAKDLISKDISRALVITSNGIARFSPCISEDLSFFAASHDIKIGTGCLCIFNFDGVSWKNEGWNIKPKDFL